MSYLFLAGWEHNGHFCGGSVGQKACRENQEKCQVGTNTVLYGVTMKPAIKVPYGTGCI